MENMKKTVEKNEVLVCFKEGEEWGIEELEERAQELGRSGLKAKVWVRGLRKWSAKARGARERGKRRSG